MPDICLNDELLYKLFSLKTFEIKSLIIKYLQLILTKIENGFIIERK